MYLPIFAAIFSLIVVMVILSTSIEAIVIENHSVYTSHSSPSSGVTVHADFNFAAAGDWGCNVNTNNTVNNILNKNPELLLGLGDYSYNITSDDCWFQRIQPLDAKMKIAIGNHDYRGVGQLDRYMNHFGLKEQYYSFDYQNIHFIVLSTEIPYNATSAQYEFVKNNLPKAASDPNIDWIIVYFH